MSPTKHLVAALVVIIAGCNGSGEPTGTVTGRVTFEGAPLSEGTVSFSSEGGSSIVASAVVQSDGAYVLELGEDARIPIGQYKVSVHPPAPPFDPANPAPLEIKEYPNIPPRYRDPASSPLQVDIVEGKQEWDFDLTR